jgi:hypothetical protein
MTVALSSPEAIALSIVVTACLISFAECLILQFYQ